MDWTARRGATRAALWCGLFAGWSGVTVTAALRPAAAFLAAACGTPLVWVPAVLLARTRPPWRRRPPKHARYVDVEARLRLADAEQQLHGYGKFFTALGLREPKSRAWEPRVIKGDDGKEGGPGEEAGLTRSPLVLVG